MRYKFFLAFVLILSIALGSATIQLGEPNNSITKEYVLGANLSGAVNISFNSEPLISIITDNFANSITLEQILNHSINSGFTYTCDTMGCEPTYSELNPEAQKQFTLNQNQSKTIGFKFTGTINTINSLEFNVQSDAPSSCQNQLKIDLLDDGTPETGNTQQSTQTCGVKNYSCFDIAETGSEIIISSTPFCQKFTLQEAPGFKIGAWVKETTAGTKSIFMKLYSENGNELTSCELSKAQITGSGSEVSCEIEYLLTEPTDHYICLVEGSGTGTYKTRGYTPAGEKCGFNGLPPQNLAAAYQIFVQNSKFSSVGTIYVENTLPNGELLSVKMKNYIISTYGGLDCSETCIVPLTINSNTDQIITLSNLQLEYDAVGLPGLTETQFYDLQTTPAKITSTPQNLFFNEAEFSLPALTGYNPYTLNLNGQNIYSGELLIQNVSISISPKNIPVMLPTTIEAQAYTDNNITKYFWDFGDNSSQTTFIPEVIHTYTQKGTYNLILEITDNESNVFSKSFIITVEDSKDVIDNKIAELNSKIIALETQMASLDDFTKQMFTIYTGFDQTKKELAQIELNYSINENDTSFIPTLMSLTIPKGFIKIPTSQISYYPSEYIINLDILESIQGETYERGKEDDYIKSILAWFQKNIDAKITMTEVLIQTDDGVMPGFRTFAIDLSKKQTLSQDPDVVIREIEGLIFKNSYGKNSTMGYTHFKLGSTTHLDIYTTEQIGFQELPLSISPSFSNVLISEGLDITPEKKNYKPLIMIILILIILGLGVMAYFMIGKWYREKYENKLFPNKNDLYNMVTYVNNSKKKGMKNGQIRKNLSKVGWNSEQITYVMKKYAGKNTGVPGIRDNTLSR